MANICLMRKPRKRSAMFTRVLIGALVQKRHTQTKNVRLTPGALCFPHQPASLAMLLVASCNFSRQYVELIDVPIANEHLDRGNHCLIAVASLGVA